MDFLFRSDEIFRTTQVRIFFQNLTLGYMTKTLNHIFFFSTKIRIFFSPTLGIRTFFQKKNHNPPLQVKWSVPNYYRNASSHYERCLRFITTNKHDLSLQTSMIYQNIKYQKIMKRMFRVSNIIRSSTIFSQYGTFSYSVYSMDCKYHKQLYHGAMHVHRISIVI